jgi:phenylacetic acid degradation operon negative regulatory protein
VKPKTEELLYLLFWTCDMAMRPTFRNLTDSFEAWAYRNGLGRQLQELERRELLALSGCLSGRSRGDLVLRDAVLRLTESGRLHVLGGRDPERQWRRSWDGKWRLILFDFPVRQNKLRNRLRTHLRHRGFGYLQDSVWVTPDPVTEERVALAGSAVRVESLLLLEARTCAGESNEEVVACAWNFQSINARYSDYRAVLDEKPDILLPDDASATAFRAWAARERQAWLAAVTEDPLLPAELLPPGYLGRIAWKERLRVLGKAARQLRDFHPERDETFEHVFKSFGRAEGGGKRRRARYSCRAPA